MSRLFLVISLAVSWSWANPLVADASGPQRAESVRRVDQHGDPLPEGAVARLGSVRLRGVLGRGDEHSMATLRDNRVVLVNPDTGAEVRRLPGPDPSHLEAVSFALSDDLRYVAYIGKILCEVWDADHGQAVISRRSPTVEQPARAINPWMNIRSTGHVPKVVLTKTAMYISAPGLGSVLQKWDCSTGTLKWQYKTTGFDTLTALQPLGMTSDDHSLVAVQSNGAQAGILMINAEKGVVERRIKVAQGVVPQPVAYSANADQVAFFDTESKIRRFQLATGQGLEPLEGEKDRIGIGLASLGITALAYSPDGQKLAAAGFSSCSVFETATGLRIVNQGRGRFGFGCGRQLVFSANGRDLWQNCQDHPRWQKLSGDNFREQTLPVYQPQEPLRVVCAAPLGDYVATMDDHGEYQLWNCADGRLKKSQPLQRGWLVPRLVPDFSRHKRLKISPDGSRLAVGAADQICIVDVATQAIKTSIATKQFAEGVAIAFSPNGKTLAVGPQTNIGLNRAPEKQAVIIADAQTGQVLRQFEVEWGVNYYLEFSPDGRFILGSFHGFLDRDGKTVVHDIETGDCCRSELGHAARFVPRSNLIAFATPTHIALLEPLTGEIRVRCELPPGVSIEKLAVAFDGRWLAGVEGPTGSHQAHVWDLSTGAYHQTLISHNGPVTDVAFGANNQLITISEDMTGLVWNVRPRADDQWPPPTNSTELAACWNGLAGPAPQAHRAIEQLLRGTGTVNWIRQHLRPAAALDQKTIQQLFNQLESPNYAERRRAGTELERLDQQLQPWLQTYMMSTSSHDGRWRARALLHRLKGSVQDPELLTSVRAVEVLHRFGTPDARALLKDYAQGERSARLTQHALRSLQQLEQENVAKK